MARVSKAENVIHFVRSHLNRSAGSSPLYVQIANLLADAIKSETIGEHKVIPSERMLASKLGVSRVTVRRALDDLSASGLVTRKQGARSAVTPRVEKTLSLLTGFSEELRARGAVPGQKWLLKEVTLPTPSESMALGISPQEKIARLVRIRLADNVPIAFEKAIVPQVFLADPDLVKESLYDALRMANCSPTRGIQRIRAGVMTVSEAKALASEPGAPLLIVERRCFLPDGRTVEFTETRYHGERYDFVADLQSIQLLG